MLKKTINYLSIIIIIIGAIFIVNGFILAWSPPGSAPPSGNVSAPLNVGSIGQLKAGALGVNGVFRGYSNGIFDGNVGIGTTGPEVPLHVKGTAGDILLVENSVANSNPNIAIKNDARQWQMQVVGARNDNFEVMDATQSNSNPVLTLQSITGNVGIGTANPGAKLHVVLPTAEPDTANAFEVWDWDGPDVSPFVIKGDGSVGIGTTNPATRLHIQADNAHIRLTGGSYTSLELQDGGTGDPGYITWYYNGGAVAQVGMNATYFNSGNVGIGTTSPVQKLDVAGKIHATDDICTDAAGGKCLSTGGGGGTEHTNCFWTVWSTCAAGGVRSMTCLSGKFVAGVEQTGCNDDGCADPTKCEKTKLYCCGGSSAASCPATTRTLSSSAGTCTANLPATPHLGDYIASCVAGTFCDWYNICPDLGNTCQNLNKQTFLCNNGTWQAMSGVTVGGGSCWAEDCCIEASPPF